MAEDKKTPGQMGPEKGISRGHAVPDEEDTEGQGVRFGRAIPSADKPGPDEIARFRAISDEEDAQGHSIRFGRAIPDANKPGPDGAVKYKAIPDEEDAEGHGVRGKG